jgi:hypothetical protein
VDVADEDGKQHKTAGGEATDHLTLLVRRKQDKRVIVVRTDGIG